MKQSALKLLILGIIFLAAIISVFVFSADPEFHVLERKLSPDSRMEALLAMPKTGATDGFVDWIYVVKRGDLPTGKPIFVADKIDGDVGLSWSSNNEIKVTAKSARIFKSDPTNVSLPDGTTAQVTIDLDIADIHSP